MAVTCLILGTSGGIRLWRGWQFRSLAQESAACPFPLSDLPKTLGSWQASDEEVQLDPEVARFAGATDHFVRNYVDRRSSEPASVLALYGSAEMVHLHTPEACYPAAGYQPFKGPVDRSIDVPGMKVPLRYRWAVYRKKVGGVDRLEEVCYSFFHHGDWRPDVADRWKTFRYYPGLFKIQIAHPVSTLTEGGEGPCLALLADLARGVSERVATPAPTE